MADRDWYEWHLQYEDPESHLTQRLATVQSRIRAALDEAAPGPLRLEEEQTVYEILETEPGA